MSLPFTSLLQCLGAETVVFAKRGARTVGLDISRESIKQARHRSPRVRVPGGVRAAVTPKTQRRLIAESN